MDKLHAITENITKHDDSLFTEGGKPKTGLNCLHNFNNEKRHYIKSGLEKDVLHLVKDLDRVMAKYKANMNLAPGPQHLKQEREKAKKNGKRGSSELVKIEEKDHAAFSVPWEEPPLLRVLVFCNWKQLIVKPYICLPQRQTRHACAPRRRRGGGGITDMKGAGMLVGNVELNL